MMDFQVLAVLAVIVIAFLLALKVLIKVWADSKRELMQDATDAFGEKAINLLKKMKEADETDDKHLRVVRRLQTIEERNKLLSNLDEHERQMIINCTENRG